MKKNGFFSKSAVAFFFIESMKVSPALGFNGKRSISTLLQKKGNVPANLANCGFQHNWCEKKVVNSFIPMKNLLYLSL
jgi:hypothetical protein